MSDAVAEPVERFRIHRDADDLIRRRFVNRASLRRGVTRREAGDWYDNELTVAQMVAAASAVGMALPAVGGPFADWLANVDWDKLFEFIVKLIELFGKFA